MIGPNDDTKDSSDLVEAKKPLFERRNQGKKLQINQELAETVGKLEDLLWSKLEEASTRKIYTEASAIDEILNVLKLGKIEKKEEAINAIRLLGEGKIEKILQTEWMRERAKNYSQEKNAKSASENFQKTENADSSQILWKELKELEKLRGNNSPIVPEDGEKLDAQIEEKRRKLDEILQKELEKLRGSDSPILPEDGEELDIQIEEKEKEKEFHEERTAKYSKKNLLETEEINDKKTENANSSLLKVQDNLKKFKEWLEKETNVLEKEQRLAKEERLLRGWQGLTEEQKSLREWQEKLKLQDLSAVNGKVKEILEALEIKEVAEALKNGGMRKIKNELDIEKIAKVIEETKNYIQEGAKSRLKELEEKQLQIEKRWLAGGKQALQEIPAELQACDAEIEKTKNYIQKGAESRLEELKGRKEWLKEEQGLLEAGWEWLEEQESLEAEQRLQKLSKELRACDAEIEKTKNYIQESAKSRLKELEEKQLQIEQMLLEVGWEWLEGQENLEAQQRLQKLSEELQACDAEIEKTKNYIQEIAESRLKDLEEKRLQGEQRLENPYEKHRVEIEKIIRRHNPEKNAESIGESLPKAEQNSVPKEPAIGQGNSKRNAIYITEQRVPSAEPIKEFSRFGNEDKKNASDAPSKSPHLPENPSRRENGVDYDGKPNSSSVSNETEKKQKQNSSSGSPALLTEKIRAACLGLKNLRDKLVPMSPLSPHTQKSALKKRLN